MIVFQEAQSLAQDHINSFILGYTEKNQYRLSFSNDVRKSSASFCGIQNSKNILHDLGKYLEKEGCIFMAFYCIARLSIKLRILRE